MPERYFDVRWPDDHQESCYSPSSSIEQYFSAGQQYPLDQFVALSDQALKQASERVRQKYGYACSSAMDQLSQIKQRATRYKNMTDPQVLVVRIS